MTAIAQRIRGWAQRLRRDALALWIAARSPETPLAARLIALLVTAYAFSPIDLIPDFIPVLGYLDDALLLPALIWLAVRLLPPAVVVDSRAQADAWMTTQGHKPVSRAGAVLIVGVWLAVAFGAWVWWSSR